MPTNDGATEALDRWLYRAGYVGEWMRMLADRDTLDPPPAEEPVAEEPQGAFGLLPRPVDFSRAMLAGVVATMLSDALDVVESSLAARKFGTSLEISESPALPRFSEPGALGSRYGSGVRRAVQYARFLHPRLPGPPVLRGLCYGLLEAAVSPGIASKVAKGRWRSPEEVERLALEVSRHLAFGATVGLVFGMLEERGGEVRGDRPATVGDEGTTPRGAGLSG